MNRKSSVSRTTPTKGKAKAASKKSTKEIELRNERKQIPIALKTLVLTEAGYRCAVPQCRNILAIHLHHIHQVAYGGKDELSNLIALCPYCHGLYHSGHFAIGAIFSWKAMLVAISRAFDLEAIDRLLYLEQLERNFLVLDGSGLLSFSRLIAAGLATGELYANNNGLIVTYVINISEKGRMLISAWRSGDTLRLRQMVSGPVPGISSGGSVP